MHHFYLKVAVIALSLNGSPAYADIFVCKDHKNHVTYQQEPCKTQTIRTLKKEPEVPLIEQIKARERIDKANASYEAYAAKTEIELLQQEKLALEIENRALENRARQLESQANAPQAVFVNPNLFGSRPFGARSNQFNNSQQNNQFNRNRIYNNDSFRSRMQNSSTNQNRPRSSNSQDK